MRRALDLLEKAARAESERSRQMYDIESKAEAAAASKFQNLVAELRETWDVEEATRAKQLDERLRNHYDTVIDHMQSQLDAALKLNDDADKQWMEDVEARNRQQVSTMQAYEEKCRRLYQTRLTEYVERTDAEVAEYEGMLLEAGSNSALQSARFESHLRRVKMACSKWRADYQKEIEKRYEQTVSELDARYMAEISSLLQQLSEANAQLATMDERVQEIHARSEAEVKKAQMEERKAIAEKESEDNRKLALRQNELQLALSKLWTGLRTPASEQVEILEKLVDASYPSENMMNAYEFYNEKLSAQLPLIQMATRREYLKFRIKALRRFAGQSDLGQANSSDQNGDSSLFSSLNISSYEELEQDFEKHTNEYSLLDERLEKGITEYNDRFKSRFMYNGSDYSDVIISDRRAEQALSDIDEKLRQLESQP